MHKTKSRAFTLIELIIVIAIIAILAVTAFLVLTKWMGKSRDSRRVNDISAINSALQIYISDASLIPLPDSYSGVYDTGYALAWYQGNFTDNIASQLSNISKNIKDPQSGYYGYSVTYDRKQYQLRALTENTTSYMINQVYAASQTAKMQGNYAGFLVTYTGSLHSLWNVPSLFLFSGTAITSGTQFTGGNNNFLQDNKTTDNIYPLAIVDVSNLYNSDTSDDSAVYTNIVNAYSGTNNVISQSGATAVVQSAAGGIVTNNSSATFISDSYTKLLLHMDGGNLSTTFIDSSSTNKNVGINGNAQMSTTRTKFGSSVGYLDGVNSYLSFPDSSDWDLSTTDFTIDFWLITNNSTTQMIISKLNSSAYGWYVQIVAGKIRFCTYQNSNYFDSSVSVTNGVRHHIAIVKTTAKRVIYVDGINVGESSNTTSENVLSNMIIGQRNNSQYLYCAIDELRISKGIARRTSNFTPPTSPYTN